MLIYVSSNLYNKLHNQCFLRYQQTDSYSLCRRYLNYVAYTAVKTIHMVFYSELHIPGMFLCGKCSVWKKGQYGTSWVKKALVILLTKCWWPITQAGRRGSRDLCQMIATWERTYAGLLSIAGLLEYVTASVQQRSSLTCKKSPAGPLHCNSLQHFLKANGLARMKTETTGSQTNSMGQKPCLYLTEGFLSAFSESWKIHFWAELLVLQII